MQNREVVILNSKQAIAQPMQLDLFRVLADPSYSNVSGFYQSLPDTVP